MSLGSQVQDLVIARFFDWYNIHHAAAGTSGDSTSCRALVDSIEGPKTPASRSRTPAKSKRAPVHSKAGSHHSANKINYFTPYEDLLKIIPESSDDIRRMLDILNTPPVPPMASLGIERVTHEVNRGACKPYVNNRPSLVLDDLPGLLPVSTVSGVQGSAGTLAALGVNTNTEDVASIEREITDHLKDTVISTNSSPGYILDENTESPNGPSGANDRTDRFGESSHGISEVFVP
ncbi:hypothetical protein DL93DRAFT_2088941 [Clavulina sp. PMI_390]|nr:hypothetical protein DL93DRAFT_2088941 [Clavulina sp. PMI_390]